MGEQSQVRRPSAFLLSLLLGLAAGGCGQEPVPATGDLRAALQIPHFRNPLQPRLDETWKRRNLVFERVRFQGRYGDWIPALVCYSELARARPLPVVICMPGSPNIKEDLLQPVDLIPRWAGEGFFILSIDRPYHGERQGDLGAAIRAKGLLRVWGEFIYDLMRAVDYVETRPEADPERIGMLGLSMGGMEGLLLAALDARVQVVVSVAGQLSWDEIFRGGYWEWIFRGLELRHELVRSGVSGSRALRAFREAYPGMDRVDAPVVVPLIAPRPLLLMVGEEDPFIPPAAARRTFQAGRAAYQAQGDRLELWVVSGAGHSFPPQMQERALEWFVRWL